MQNGRPSNMDSLLLKSGRIKKANAMLGVVCDGVGSLADGGFASGIAVKMLSDWFNNVKSIKRIGLALRDEVLSINSYIVEEAKKRSLDTASTLTALLLVESDYYITHIGDSRIYCYNDGAFTILTSDDVTKSGKLTGYIGKYDIFLQYSEGTAIDKVFLICSDGLYNRISEHVLEKEINSWNKRSSKEPLERLAQHVIELGEKDNISLAFMRLES